MTSLWNASAPLASRFVLGLFVLALVASFAQSYLL